MYSLLNMSELVIFVTGLFMGLAGAVIFKRSAKELPKEISKTKKSLNVVKQLKGDCKMTFVVRNDLNMTKGKIASQCALATLLCYKIAVDNSVEMKPWHRNGEPKVVLKTDGGEQEILKLAEKADELGIVNAVVRDTGCAQLKRGTITVLGIGVDSSKSIDKVSGHLKLL